MLITHSPEQNYWFLSKNLSKDLKLQKFRIHVTKEIFIPEWILDYSSQTNNNILRNISAKKIRNNPFNSMESNPRSRLRVYRGWRNNQLIDPDA